MRSIDDSIETQTLTAINPLEPHAWKRVFAGSGGDTWLAQGRALLVLDGILAICACVLAYIARYIWHVGGWHENVILPSLPRLIFLAIVAVVLVLADLAHSGSYRRRLSATGVGFGVIMHAATLASIVVIVTGAALQEQNIARLVYVYGWLAMVGLLSAGRIARLSLLASIYRHGRGLRRVVVVGATPTGKMVMQNVASHRNQGYYVLGFVRGHGEPVQRFGRFPCLGTIADIDRVLREHDIDEVIIALPSESHSYVGGIIQQCKDAGVGVRLVPDLFDLCLSRVCMDAVAGIPLIAVRTEQRHRMLALTKRAFDVSIATLILIVAAPIMLITALAIALDSPGPILFRQERLGRHGRPFTMLKFRSMCLDAERQMEPLRCHNEAAGPIFKMRHDPRVTRVGRIIRKLSIDELPQVWNVLRGDMSLVGPRPPLASEVARYEDWHRRRLDSLPGITSLWGVSGRSTLDFDEMVMLDLYYLDNWSLGLDVHILFRTVLTLLRPSGAY